MRVALVSSKLGYVRRGFESFSRELFDQLKGTIDVTLFKGAGEPAEQEVPVRCIRSEGGILSRLGLSEHKRMLFQERVYAARLISRLLHGRFDIIHFSEAEIGRILMRARKVFRTKWKLLYSNGAPAPPKYYHYFDCVQEVNQVFAERAVDFGISADRIWLVPYGVDCHRFQPAPSAREDLRRKYGIPTDSFVVLCTAAIKREHKRIDWLISECSQLSDPDLHLVVAGQTTPETEGLRQMATELLGERFSFTSVDHSQIFELYQLADVFVLPSLSEGLPIVVLEAMATGLPVITHNAALYRWVVCGDGLVIDMTSQGQLASTLAPLRDNGRRSAVSSACRKSALTRFDWSHLKNKYISMYEEVYTESRRCQDGETTPRESLPKAASVGTDPDRDQM